MVSGGGGSGNCSLLSEVIRIMETVNSRRNQWSGSSLTEGAFALPIYFFENFVAAETLHELIGFLFADLGEVLFPVIFLNFSIFHIFFNL